MKKRVVPLLLAVAVLFSLLPITAFTALAAEDAGGDFATARSIPVNSSISDDISDRNDHDYYCFTLRNAGTVSLTFEHPAIFEQNEYWCAWLYNDATDEISFYSFLGTDTATTTYLIGLSAGTYYLRITGGDYYNGSGHRFSSETYTFKVNFTETEYAERENNESFADATAIKSNKTYTASINDRDDKDYYKFTLGKAGTVSLDFGHKDLTSAEEYWCAWLYNEKTEEISFHSFAGTNTATTTYLIGLSAGTYYLRITGGDYYNGFGHRFSSEAYTFKVNYTETEYAERENNESFADATTIKSNKTYTASINDRDDKDYYKFTLGKAGTVSLDFGHKDLTSAEEYWCAWLYNEKTEEISFHSFAGTNTSTTTCLIGLSAGTYYLRITGGAFGGYWNRSDRFSTETYTFKVNYTETEYAERENNDSFATATAAKLRKTYSGSINDSTDVDYYKLSLSKAGTITIKFTAPNLEKKEEYWVVKIYDKDNKDLDSFSVTGTKAETLLGGYSYPAGEYYIRVTGGAFGGYWNKSDRFSTKSYGLYITDEHLVHVYNGEKTTPATCTECGTVTLYCTCGKSVTYENEAALGHDYSWDYVSATCLAEGYDIYTCRRCGHVEKDNYTKARGHNYKNGKCTRCGASDPNYTTSVSFKDVAKNAWYKEAVDYAVSNGLMNGMGNNKFEPDTATNRAMLVTILWRYAGSPSGGTNNFNDVANGQWFTKAVTWAARRGIVTGVGNNKFDPEGKLTREQLATILFRYAKMRGKLSNHRASFTRFSDGKKVQSWSKEAMQWAVAEGIIGGTTANGKLYLDPQGNATRAQVATILMRFIENVLK